MVLARDSRLMDIHGVGAVVAARILADVGDVARFADRNRFASWTGTAPLDASSGEQNRHRLSRAGNRRVNHMIHIAAVTQIRLDTEGRAYYRRKRAEGKKPHGSACAASSDGSPTPSTASSSPTPNASECGSGRALRGVSKIQRGRPAPAHRHFGSATPGPAATTLRRTIDGPEEQTSRPLQTPVDNRGEPE